MEKVTKEILAVRKTIFVDYCNVRDHLKRTTRRAFLALSPSQSSRLLTVARKHYRRREIERNEKWFDAFKETTRRKFAASPIPPAPSRKENTK